MIFYKIWTVIVLGGDLISDFSHHNGFVNNVN